MICSFNKMCIRDRRGNPFAFKLSDNGFEWIGNYDISADELLDGMKRKSDKDRAKDLSLIHISLFLLHVICSRILQHSFLLLCLCPHFY